MSKLSRLFEFVHRDPDAEVLVITNMWPEPSRPAYGAFVKRQVEALRAEGLRCDVLYARGYLSKLVYVLGVPYFLWLSLSARRRYRLAHVHCGEMALVARFLLRPMIATYHGDDVLGYKSEHGVSRASRVRSFAIRHHATLFRATVTQSGEMDRLLPPWVRRRSSIVPCGVDERRFAPADRDAARRELDWDPAERIVLFAATRPYEPRKRFDLAKAAVERAEAELGEPIRLAVAENRPPDSIPVMMNAADCLLLTSMAEGSPVVVKEAIMCNLPVVATDVADVGEMLAGVSPSAVLGHDPAEIGAALAEILRGGRRSDGRERRSDLTQTTTVSRLLALYDRHAGLRVARAARPGAHASAGAGS